MKRVWYVFALLFLCIAVVFAGYLAWRYFQYGEKPIATILSPETSLVLEAGDGISVAVQAEAQAGISRIVLLVDGAVYAEESASEETTLTVAFPWYATSLGSHTLEAVVYDSVNQASDPVSVLVGVRARLKQSSLDFEYIPSADAADIGADGGGGNANGQVVPVGNANNGQPNAEGEILGDPLSPDEIGGQGDLPVLDENDLAGNPLTDEDIDALQDSQDAIPTITAFDAQPRRNGQAIQIAFHVEAQDDLGVNRLEFYVENTLTRDSSPRTMLCFDGTFCTVDDVYPFAEEGSWIISVFAVDTSGQVSEPHLLSVEILGHEEFDPALAIADAFADRPLVADFLGERDFGIPIDFNNANPDVNVDNSVTAERSCIQGLVEPRENGNFVSATLLCEGEALEGAFLQWEIRVSPTYSALGSETILKREFQDRTSYSSGDNFSFLHEIPFCGTPSNYRIFLRWVRIQGNRFEPVFGGSEVIDVWNVPGKDCGEDALIQDFRAEPLAGLVQLSWRATQHPDLSRSVDYILRRYDPTTRERVDIQAGTIDREQIAQADLSFSFSDEAVTCGFNPYFYSIVLSRYDSFADSSITVEVDRVPCPEGSIGNIAIDLHAGYYQDSDVPTPLSPYRSGITAHSVIPAGFAWAQGENLVLRLNVEDIGRGSGDFEVLSGNPTEIPITDAVRANGFVFDSVAYAECSGLHHRWGYAWELLSNGVPIETGPVFEVASSPCVPNVNHAPIMTSVRGSSESNFCSSNPNCVVLEWGPLPPFPEDIFDPNVLLQVDALGIYRRIVSRIDGDVGVPAQLWTISAEQNAYIDTSVPCTESAGDLVYSYSLIAMGQGVHEGLTSGVGGRTAFIDSPACGGTYTATGRIVE
ncbi:MAG: Ig-like domain-containing protein [Anaerolineae bacterium]|jgi:hypothetical protein|nr:Ig-like domain-containing protein [Anaerolineae bacterium]MBT7070103.1 Ig-like domain-containing protein [Anaerolineae bacterium]MBT7325787.1 Ig-like domain-containing protein [Anaerolineae bacterium]